MCISSGLYLGLRLNLGSTRTKCTFFGLNLGLTQSSSLTSLFLVNDQWKLTKNLLLLEPTALAAAYQKICIKIHDAIFMVLLYIQPTVFWDFRQGESIPPIGKLVGLGRIWLDLVGFSRIHNKCMKWFSELHLKAGFGLKKTFLEEKSWRRRDFSEKKGANTFLEIEGRDLF